MRIWLTSSQCESSYFIVSFCKTVISKSWFPYRFRELDDQSQIVHGVELDQRLQSINKKLPNILNYVERDVQELEAELEHLVIMEGDYEVQINDMTSVN